MADEIVSHAFSHGYHPRHTERLAAYCVSPHDVLCGRDGVVKYTLGEIEKERRTGYAWYVEAPRRVLERYPAWRARWGSAR
jgi:hypothetical protein